FSCPEIFELVTDPLDERFGGLEPDMVRAMASGFAAGYVDPAPDVPWFDQIRTLAGELGFALRQKDYKKNPDAYPGSIADAAAVIRVLVTGSRQSPDLEQTCAALGRAEVLRRVNALSWTGRLQRLLSAGGLPVSPEGRGPIPRVARSLTVHRRAPCCSIALALRAPTGMVGTCR